MKTEIPARQNSSALQVQIGQHSRSGIKKINQDFHGACIPADATLRHKGVALAVADGISSSTVSHLASETAVAGFMADYYSTPESWTVKQSAHRVLSAINGWLYAQTRHGRFYQGSDQNRGYVCTFSLLILKAAVAHFFHIGDSRIWRRRDGIWEQLTEDHRIRFDGNDSSLTRALGVRQHLECDYHQQDVRADDLFMLATDGLYEFISLEQIDALLEPADDLDAAAAEAVTLALSNGSDDNLTVQFLRVVSVPPPVAGDMGLQAASLSFAPEFRERMLFEGYRILRPLHQSSRSHVWQALDESSGALVAIKLPSVDLRNDPVYLERFLLEEWIARKLDNPHVVAAFNADRPKKFCYGVYDYVEGQSLSQWMRDNPKPPLEKVRDIIGQLVRGVRAFHRQAMLHQDLRPENIIIDRHGLLKIIDFGSVRVAGIEEVLAQQDNSRRGTIQYSAPESFLGEIPQMQSDQFSVGVIAYQLLSGHLPYGDTLARIRSARDLQRLPYRPLASWRDDIPLWVDDAIRRAVQPDMRKRYLALSEFVLALQKPDADSLQTSRPLIERNPLAFWQGTALLFALLAASLGVWVLHLKGF